MSQTMPHSALKRLEVRFSSGPHDAQRVVGTLAERAHRMYFEYDAAWLEQGWELSPFTLKARPGLIEHTRREFGPLPGLFDDSLPDGWGLLLMDRAFRLKGHDPTTLSALDRLAWLGTRTMGALTYHPATDEDPVSGTPFHLHTLSEQAREVYSGEAAEVLPQLLRAGGSPGGARPKVLVGYNPKSDEILCGASDLPEGFEHWIVKFPTDAEGPEAGAIEYAYSSLAREAGLHVPETRIFETAEGERFFGVRRFDRTACNRRFHVHTFGNLIETNFRIPSCDYSDLLKATYFLTRDRHAVSQVFRQMVFNIAAHNRDDHAKNFAFLFDTSTNSWAPTPAYDLTFSTGPGGEHSTTVNGEGRAPTREHMLALTHQCDINPSQAEAMIEEVYWAISKWREVAEIAKVSERSVEAVAKSLA